MRLIFELHVSNSGCCVAQPSGICSWTIAGIAGPLNPTHLRLTQLLEPDVQVAEVDQEIVGVVRAGIKTVVCGKSGAKSVQSGSRSRTHLQDVPIYAKAAYLLGLRVSPAHR